MIPHDAFCDFVDRVPSVQRQLLITMSRRIRKLQEQLSSQEQPAD